MAANMMDLLKQIQIDLNKQKEFMKNLHVTNRNLNENFNLINVNILDLDKKIEKQQVAIENIEEHVKKNNMVLYGNDDTQNTLELQNGEQETEWKCVDDNTRNDWFENADNNKMNTAEFISNEMRETRESIRKFMATTTTTIEEMASLLRKDETVPTARTDAITNQIKELNNGLKNITDMYQSDMKEMKELIKNLVAATESTKEATSKADNQISVAPNNISTEQISQISVEFKRFNDAYCSEVQTKQELKDDVVALVNKLSGVATSHSGKRVVQISPSYLNSEQIYKLREELQKITDSYRLTGISPIIEVISGPSQHPIIQQLGKGVVYKGFKRSTGEMTLKLEPYGVSKLEVVDLLIDYPDLNLYEVVKALTIARDAWDRLSKEYNFHEPYHHTEFGLRHLFM